MAEKKNLQHSFEETLFNIFANSYNPQEYRNFWAIQEGVQRSPFLKYEYESPKAAKEHTCERGCKIKQGDYYFKSTYPYSQLKICATCMAMILYYQDVWLFPVYQHDYWDDEANRPHFANDGIYAKTLRAAVEKR